MNIPELKDGLLFRILEGLEDRSGKGFGEEHLAALRLCEAAPDLLAACKAARDGWDKLDALESPKVLAQLDAAIAKAEGGKML